MSFIKLDIKGHGTCPTCNVPERKLILRSKKLYAMPECQVCKRPYSKNTWADVIWTQEGYVPPVEE